MVDMRPISNKKIKSFQAEMEKKNIEIAVFLSLEPIYDSNIEYFTGFRQDRNHSFSCLIIENGKMSLVVSRLEYDRAVKEVKGVEIIDKKDYDNSLVKVLKSKLRGKKNIGINTSLFPYGLYKKFSTRKYFDVSRVAYKLRSIKEPGEIDIIEKAAKMTNHGVKVINDNLSQKITQKELALILEQDLMRKGAEGFSFPPIIKSGDSSAYIHPYPGASDEKIKRGLGLIDFGIIYKGYCTDITVPLEIGKLNSKEILIKKTVEEAYRESVDSLNVNLPAWKAFDVAKNIIEENGFEFKHSLGHGIGLDVHELPNLSPKPEKKKDLKNWREEKLEKNMIFTVEPGVYVPGVGGYRLENDILMTNKGPEVLTKSKPIRV